VDFVRPTTRSLATVLFSVVVTLLVYTSAGAAFADAHTPIEARTPHRVEGWHCTAPGCGGAAPVSHFGGFLFATLGAVWWSRRSR
jgi:hypothetical protein